MPIANCFLTKKNDLLTAKGEEIITVWAQAINVDPSDITMNWITNFHQFGRSYAILVNLYLPTLWSERDIHAIQRSLQKTLTQLLAIEETEIFILTSLIQSGHVVENGNAVLW
jgi:hypothetical protein